MPNSTSAARARRQYLSRLPAAAQRHRGTRSPRVKEETAVLASLLTLIGVMQNQPHPAPAHAAHAQPPQAAADQEGIQYGVARGLLLCQAFEAYRALIPSAQISFEHAVFLTAALSRGDQLRLDTCRECGGLVVVERFPERDPRCRHCRSAAFEK